MLSNLLKFPIYVRKFTDDKIVTLASSDIISYEPGSDKAAIQVSSNEEDWSGPFALDNIEDFQIRFLKSEDQKQAKSAKN